jgi:heterodisulfide reductase subunit B
MQGQKIKTLSFFPGCSLASAHTEHGSSLKALCRYLNIELAELVDWNCCGSSSAHSINRGLAGRLAGRNLSLAPPGRPLLVACPNCYLRLKEAQKRLATDSSAREKYENDWCRPFDNELKIVHLFEILEDLLKRNLSSEKKHKLQGLKFAPYYGCMQNRPPALYAERKFTGILEGVLSNLGASPISWSGSRTCCGTFLSVTRPEAVTKIVNNMMDEARQVNADCIVTACAMCHLNLEIRATVKNPMPVLYISELISLAFGQKHHGPWFARHIVDPRPMLNSHGLL